MNTLHLEYAITVARTGSITQAAEELFMAQPNLSKSIRELEDSLGIEIFRRTPKGMVPTAQGQAFLRYAASVLEQVAHMEALGRGGGAAQRFCLALPHAPYIAQAAAQLISQAEIPGDIRLREVEGLDALREVQEGRVDLAVARHSLAREPYFADLLDHGNLTCERLWEFDARPVLHKSHPLAARAQVEAAELETWTELRFLEDDLSRRPPLPGQRTVCISSRAALPATLEGTAGYMWSEPLPADALEAQGLAQPACPFRGDQGLRWRDVLIFPKGQSLSPLYRRFIDMLYQARNVLAFA